MSEILFPSVSLGWESNSKRWYEIICICKSTESVGANDTCSQPQH